MLGWKHRVLRENDSVILSESAANEIAGLISIKRQWIPRVLSNIIEIEDMFESIKSRGYIIMFIYSVLLHNPAEPTATVLA